jgi:hypothetical protein
VRVRGQGAREGEESTTTLRTGAAVPVGRGWRAPAPVTFGRASLARSFGRRRASKRIHQDVEV